LKYSSLKAENFSYPDDNNRKWTKTVAKATNFNNIKLNLILSGIAAKQRISVILLAPAFPQGTQQSEEKNLPICLSYLAFTENDYLSFA
jgi:hypothetical protein